MLDDYFEWLCGFVNADTHSDVSYRRLLRTLFNYRFYAMVNDDDNRALECLRLRDDSKLFKEDRNPFSPTPNFFELCVILAKRLEYLADSDGMEMNVSRWFWEILENAGLDIFTDEDFDALFGVECIPAILDTIMYRKYKSDGTMGFFPCTGSERWGDFRKLPLSMQMNVYIQCHYMEE